MLVKVFLFSFFYLFCFRISRRGLSVCLCLSVRPFAWNDLASTGRIFYEILYLSIFRTCPPQWPRSLRRRPAAARLLRSWVRIPPGAWIFVCCECCVLAGRGLWDELITRPEESYRLLCVVVCDLETSRMRRPWPALGCSATEKKIEYLSKKIQVSLPCDKNNSYFTWRLMNIYGNLAECSLEWQTFQKKLYRSLCSVTYFTRKSFRFWDRGEKYGTARQTGHRRQCW